jgi:AcrR family transcriptional regulator
MKKATPKKVVRPRNAEATRAMILEAAIDEFGSRGLRDARTEDIAAKCKVNKRMVYYYFGTKEGLYLAALESVYANLTALEHAIEVEHLEPDEAIAALVNLKIDYYIANPHFITFLNMENLYKARNLRQSKMLGEFKTPLTHVISRILERGQRHGVFRQGIDPVDLYISICALGFMYFSNQHTLGVIFERNLMSSESIKKLKRTITDLILSYLRESAAAGSAAKKQTFHQVDALVS